MIKTFRNKLAHGGQDTIRLSTSKGEIGYNIQKLQVITENPASETAELVVKVWTVAQLDAAGDPDVDAVVDFSNSSLLAVCYFEGHSNSTDFGGTTVIFDATTINQDIFVTLADGSGGSIGGNYYLELDQVKLDLNEATVATLKDMRGSG
jgi:hypothetical protein